MTNYENGPFAISVCLARKAFYPAPPPFALLHVDTGWKFQAMYAHRTRMVAESGMQLLVHTNPDGLAAGVGPMTSFPSEYAVESSGNERRSWVGSQRGR
jgi:3'-phosphoadenosine 5'-phosphosulfate sulfotransferase (PAPS reductase)/FAD synthetase